MGGKDFSGLAITVGSASIQYGLLIQAILNFLVTAIVLFALVKAINAFKRKKEEVEEEIEEEKEEEPSEEVKLLSEIRDLLKK